MDPFDTFGPKNGSKMLPLKRQCPKCGRHTRNAEEAFCPQCSTKLPEVTMMTMTVRRCEKCNTLSLLHQAAFCPKCGGKIVEVDEDVPRVELVHFEGYGQEVAGSELLRRAGFNPDDPLPSLSEPKGK